MNHSRDNEVEFIAFDFLCFASRPSDDEHFELVEGDGEAGYVLFEHLVRGHG